MTFQFYSYGLPGSEKDNWESWYEPNDPLNDFKLAIVKVLCMKRATHKRMELELKHLGLPQDEVAILASEAMKIQKGVNLYYKDTMRGKWDRAFFRCKEAYGQVSKFYDSKVAGVAYEERVG